MKKKAAPTPAHDNDPRAMIVRMLETKSSMKQDVHALTVDVLRILKELLQEIAADLDGTVGAKDRRITVKYTDKGEMAAELKVAGDTIIFHMHSNVFKLDQIAQLMEDELPDRR